MSYKKAMKHARNVRKTKKQSRMFFGFSTLGPNERRRIPIFGSSVQELDEEKVRKLYEDYDKETERLLKENPNLKLV